MSIHDYTGLTFEQIEAREAYLARHPEAGLEPAPDSTSEAEADHISPIFMDAEPAADAAGQPAPPPAPIARDPETGQFAAGWTGRPKGALNKSTLLARELLEGEAEHLVRHLIALGLSGDSLALRVAVT